MYSPKWLDISYFLIVLINLQLKIHYYLFGKLMSIFPKLIDQASSKNQSSQYPSKRVKPI